ncbi:MAG: DUF5395 domain-containing protein [Desulfohalobiaceae bacterium]|nr:DUF5395 domain-containing protein [Desulfohalobiaceae bacterium]
MIEVSLSHDGQVWTADNEHFRVSAHSLPLLDEEVRSAVAKNRHCWTVRQRRKVFMAFDDALIPGWIRQYMPHYFNRIIAVDGNQH